MCMTARKQAAQANTKRLGAWTVANVQGGTVPAPAKETDFKRQRDDMTARIVTKIQSKKIAEQAAAQAAAQAEADRQAVIKAQSDVAGANTAAIADRTVASEQAGAGYIGGDGPTVAVPTNPSGDPLDQTGGARKRKQQYGSGYNSGVSL